jgi:hypothetical protein
LTRWFACPFLGREVELTDERESHIVSRHPELLDILYECIGATLSDPDEVRQSPRVRASHVFVRWFDTILSGKHVAVVVVTDSHPVRDWVITAYAARRLSEGSVEWRRG